MSAAMPMDEQPLRAQIDRAQETIGGLEQDLQAIDGELAALAAQREQYRLLQGACDSLEKLGDLGAAGIFWGDDVDGSRAKEHIDRARGRMDVFNEQVRRIEDKRRSLLEGITEGQQVLEILEDDLFEVQEAEENRLNEWLIERELGPVPYCDHLLPWTKGTDDDQRFRKSLASSVLIVLAAGFLLPLVDLPLPEPMEELDIPERVVRLINLEEHRPVPPPVPLVEEPKPQQPKPEKPEPLLAKEPPPEAPVVEEPRATPEQEPPRKRAEAAGLLAFRDSFSGAAARTASARLGSMARIGNTGDGAVGLPERSLITTRGPGSSGGINLASISREVGGGGGGGISGVDVGRVADSIGAAPGAGGVADRPAGGNGVAGRTDEEIQIVFDRYKAALYRLYNRELRNDPTLRGQMVLRLTIEPDGSVSLCALQSSDMNAPALATQVVDRVKTFAFGAKDVAAITIVYPIDFLPAA